MSSTKSNAAVGVREELNIAPGGGSWYPEKLLWRYREETLLECIQERMG